MYKEEEPISAQGNALQAIAGTTSAEPAKAGQRPSKVSARKIPRCWGGETAVFATWKSAARLQCSTSEFRQAPQPSQMVPTFHCTQQGIAVAALLAVARAMFLCSLKGVVRKSTWEAGQAWEEATNFLEE